MGLLVDSHLHTKYSRCCREEYDLLDVAHALDEQGFEIACVTDHVHHIGEGAYISKHQEARVVLFAEGYRRPVYIGLEASIIDMDGRLATDGMVEQPDFIIAGDHWIPGTSITMDDLPAGSNHIKVMHEQDPQGLTRLYDHVAQMYINALQRNDVKILVHPFDTFTRMANFDKSLLDAFEPVCEACQERGVAIEINNQHAKRCLKYFDKMPPIHADCIPGPEFYIELMAVANKHDIMFSTCSDAHARRDIGKLDLIKRVVSECAIPDRKIIDAAAFMALVTGEQG